MATLALLQAAPVVGIQPITQHELDAFARGHNVVLAGFWSPWCFTAGLLWPRLARLSLAFPHRLGCASVALGEGEMPLSKFRVRWLPALLLVVDGVPRYRWYGGDVRWDRVEARVSELVRGAS